MNAIIRGAALRTALCAAVLLAALAVRQSADPFAVRIRQAVSRTISETTNIEDMSVFFENVSGACDDFTRAAAQVFEDFAAATADPEDGAAGSGGAAPVGFAAEYETQATACPLEAAADGEEQSAEGQAVRVVSNVDFAVNPVDTEELEDFDTGELRRERPNSAGEDLPFLFYRPVEGHITSSFGSRVNPVTGKQSFHFGVDLAAPEGSSVCCAGNGVVKEVGQSQAYGNYVTVEHCDGISTFYAHFSEVNVGEGSLVMRADELGKAGHTGWATGPHLHFEIRRDGEVLDPTPYLNAQTTLQ